MTENSTVGGTLTDNTGVSKLTGSKIAKDLVADFLLTLSATLGAGAALETLDVGAAIQTPTAVGIAVAGALIRVLYRAALRWATS